MCSDSINIRPENEVSGTSDDELIHLAYVSTQTRDMKAADLISLLTEVRGLNESRNISGLLLHKNQSFFQVIEGSRARVQETFHNIMSSRTPISIFNSYAFAHTYVSNIISIYY